MCGRTACTDRWGREETSVSRQRRATPGASRLPDQPPLAGIIIFLVWLWISNVALLLGMEFNAERERSREVKDGIPGATREIQLDPRSAPKRPKPR